MKQSLIFWLSLIISCISLAFRAWSAISPIGMFISVFVYMLLCIAMIWSILHAIKNYKAAKFRALSPLGINVAAVIMILTIPFTAIILNANFNPNPHGREKVVSQPKQVIENYFKFYNEKNRQDLLSTLTKWHSQANMVFGFKNLILMKLVSIGNNDMTMANSYLIYGRGRINGVKQNNVVSYKVIYLSLYSKAPAWSYSGIHIEYFTLIEESDNGPWLIDDSGW